MQNGCGAIQAGTNAAPVNNTPTRQLPNILLPWNVAIELIDDDAEVWRVLSALDRPDVSPASDQEEFTRWMLPAHKVASTLEEDRFDGRYLLFAREIRRQIEADAHTDVQVTVLTRPAARLFDTDFEENGFESDTADLEFSLNMSWRLAAALAPESAEHLQLQLSKLDPETKDCLSLWKVRTDWLIETLALNRFAGFFESTIDTLKRKLVFDGQVITKIYVTSATAEYPFAIPEEEYQARHAS